MLQPTGLQRVRHDVESERQLNRQAVVLVVDHKGRSPTTSPFVTSLHGQKRSPDGNFNLTINYPISTCLNKQNWSEPAWRLANIVFLCISCLLSGHSVISLPTSHLNKVSSPNLFTFASLMHLGIGIICSKLVFSGASPQSDASNTSSLPISWCSYLQYCKKCSDPLTLLVWPEDRKSPVVLYLWFPQGPDSSHALQHRCRQTAL